MGPSTNRGNFFENMDSSGVRTHKDGMKVCSLLKKYTVYYISHFEITFRCEEYKNETKLMASTMGWKSRSRRNKSKLNGPNIVVTWACWFGFWHCKWRDSEIKTNESKNMFERNMVAIMMQSMGLCPTQNKSKRMKVKEKERIGKWAKNISFYSKSVSIFFSPTNFQNGKFLPLFTRCGSALHTAYINI